MFVSWCAKTDCLAESLFTDGARLVLVVFKRGDSPSRPSGGISEKDAKREW